MKIRLYILIAATLLASGCRPAKEIVSTPVPTSQPPTVVNCPSPYASVTFSCTAEGITANGLLRMQCDSVIWVSVSKFIELGRIKMTADSVAIYLKPYNSYYHNTYSHLKAMSGIDVDFYGMQRSLWENPTAAAQQIAQWGRLLKSNIKVNLGQLRPSDSLAFPMPKPANAKPLELFFSAH